MAVRKLYDFKCESCSAITTEFARDPEAEAPLCDACGGLTRRAYTTFRFYLPPWMTDSAMASRARQREFLKTDKAKKMDLCPYREDDDDYEINSNERPAEL